jgi:energy-coupling factor transporter ATP-binding protein EcfA2
VSPGADRHPKLLPFDVEGMLASEPPSVPWIAGGLLVRGAVTMLTGREGSGKSMLALAVARAIGQGKVVADIECSRGRVLVVDAENSRDEVHRRLHGLGVEPGTVIYAGTDGFNLRTDLGQLEALLDDVRPDVLVLDSLRALAPGLEENDSGPAELTLRPLAKLARRFGCAILLLHHSRKSGDEYRGSTAIGGAVELGFALVREHTAANGGVRRGLTCWKCRPAREPDPRWFTIQADGPRVVIETAPAPAPAPARGSRTAELAKRLVAAAADLGAQPWAMLCAHAGTDPDSGTAKRAREQAIDDGLLVKVAHGVYGPAQPSVQPPPIGELDGRTDDEEGER